jgi:hypothetical protein
MPPGRLPPTLFGGRVRTSTLLLSLLFVATFALYLEVRPPPTGGAAPAVTRPRPTSSVTATSRPAPTGTTAPSRSATSTSRAATTRSTAPTPTTAGTTGTSAPSQTTAQP